MFDWLADIIRALGAIVPRVLLVRRTHGAVRFGPGGRAKTLTPGLHWYWPVIHDIDSITVARRTVNLTSQTVTTKDGRRLTVSGVLVFEVRDVERALVRAHDLDEIIANVGLTSIVEVLAGKEFQRVIDDLHSGPLTVDLRTMTRKRLRPFGVHVIACNLTDACTSAALRLLAEK